MNNFFGVGIPEILVILALALIVIGPQRLPEAAAQIGRGVRELRRYANQFRREFLDEFADVRAEWEMTQQEATEVQRQLLEAQTSVDTGVQDLDRDLARAVGDVNAALGSIDSTARVKPDDTASNVVDIEAAAQRRQRGGAPENGSAPAAAQVETPVPPSDPPPKPQRH